MLSEEQLKNQTQYKQDAAIRDELRVAVKNQALHTDPSKLLRSEKSKTGYLGVTILLALLSALLCLTTTAAPRPADTDVGYDLLFTSAPEEFTDLCLVTRLSASLPASTISFHCSLQPRDRCLRA